MANLQNLSATQLEDQINEIREQMLFTARKRIAMLEAMNEQAAPIFKEGYSAHSSCPTNVAYYDSYEARIRENNYSIFQ